MKTIHTIIVLAAIMSVPMVLGTQQAMAGTSGTTGLLTINAACELTAPATLNFNAGSSVANGAGVGTGEIGPFVLSNANGNLGSSVIFEGNNWYNQAVGPGSGDVMNVGHTVYSLTSTAATTGFAGKTALTAPTGPTVTTVSAAGTQNTFWDVEIVLDINSTFSGVAQQDITFDFTCV